MTTTTEWTDDDERLLRELASRKQEVEAHHRAAIEAVVSTFAYRGIDEDQITDALIERASQITAVLTPYIPKASESEIEAQRKKAVDAIALGLSESFGTFPASAPVIILNHLIEKAGLLPVSMKRKS